MEIRLLNTDKKLIVDDEIYYLLYEYKWRYSKDHGARATVNGRRVSASNLIMGKPPEGKIWDHKDRNRLNNQKSNLRAATYSQNIANTPINRCYVANEIVYRGIYKNGRAYTARITVHGKEIKLGTFPTMEEAAKQYDKAATEYFGEFAVLNFGDSKCLSSQNI